MFRRNPLRSLESVHLYTKDASATTLREQEARKPDSGRRVANDRGVHRRIDADIRIQLDLHQPFAKIRHSRSVVETKTSRKRPVGADPPNDSPLEPSRVAQDC